MIKVIEFDDGIGRAECDCGAIIDFDVYEEIGFTDEDYPPLKLKCPLCGQKGS